MMSCEDPKQNIRIDSNEDAMRRRLRVIDHHPPRDEVLRAGFYRGKRHRKGDLKCRYI
jgi:hypothetical protein